MPAGRAASAEEYSLAIAKSGGADFAFALHSDALAIRHLPEDRAGSTRPRVNTDFAFAIGPFNAHCMPECHPGTGRARHAVAYGDLRWRTPVRKAKVVGTCLFAYAGHLSLWAIAGCGLCFASFHNVLHRCSGRWSQA